MLNKQNLSVGLLAVFAGVFGVAPVALSQQDDVDFPEFADEIDALSIGINSAAAVFIDEDVVSAAAAFGDAGAAAIATEEGAIALGSSFDGEIEFEIEETENGVTEGLEVAVEFFEFDDDDDDDDDD